MFNHQLRHISCFLGLTIISSLAPLSSVYAITCDQLSVQHTPMAFKFNNTVYLRFALTPPPSTFNVNIPISGYSTFITNALSGDLSLGTLSFPVCFAATNGNGATWNYYNQTDAQASVIFNGTQSSIDPGGLINTIQMTGPSGVTTDLAAAVTYCPCGGFYTPGSPGTCQAAPYVILTVPGSGTYNMNDPSGFHTIGNCALGAGGVFIDIYSKAGQIPPVGNYTVDTDGLTIGVQPAN